MKLTDGKKTVEIKMYYYDGKSGSLGADWSGEILYDGRMEIDEEAEAYVVDDVDYCVDYAEDWENCRGDFYEDSEDSEELDRILDVEYLN